MHLAHGQHTVSAGGPRVALQIFGQGEPEPSSPEIGLWKGRLRSTWRAREARAGAAARRVGAHGPVLDGHEGRASGMPVSRHTATIVINFTEGSARGTVIYLHYADTLGLIHEAQGRAIVCS